MGKARILIADDDPVICDVLKEIVTDLGHQAECTTTAAETIEVVRKGSFDLVMLDLRFPDCADLSTLERIRREAPSTDIIMVTAETDDLQDPPEEVEQ